MSERKERNLISIWIVYALLNLSVITLMVSYGITNYWLRLLVMSAIMARPIVLTIRGKG